MISFRNLDHVVTVTTTTMVISTTLENSNTTI